MILIFGGAYQGKLDYALERYNLNFEDVYRCREDDTALPSGKRIIYEIDKWVYALINEGADFTGTGEKLISQNPDSIIIGNDITCGVVPADAKQRAWREEAGRLLAHLTQHSNEVYRLFCGIPTKLK